MGAPGVVTASSNANSITIRGTLRHPAAGPQAPRSLRRSPLPRLLGCPWGLRVGAASRSVPAVGSRPAPPIPAHRPMCSSEVGPGPGGGGGGGLAGDGSGGTFARPFGARSCLGMRRSTQRHPATSLACVCLCCGFCCEPLAKPPIQCVWRGRTLTQCWHTPDVANSREDAPRSRLRVWVGGGASGAGGQHGSGGRSLADD